MTWFFLINCDLHQGNIQLKLNWNPAQLQNQHDDIQRVDIDIHLLGEWEILFWTIHYVCLSYSASHIVDSSAEMEPDAVIYGHETHDVYRYRDMCIPPRNLREFNNIMTNCSTADIAECISTKQQNSIVRFGFACSGEFMLLFTILEGLFCRIEIDSSCYCSFHIITFCW